MKEASTQSKVFIAGFQGFDLVYDREQEKVISVFRGTNAFSWNTGVPHEKDGRPAKKREAP